ncbi:hypothetical protein [Nostoc sp.]|uniref:hypothetical protein n=1 Tax=Nostoc sp. TaxID=1180 RepID=UPI002FFB47ED
MRLKTPLTVNQKVFSERRCLWRAMTLSTRRCANEYLLMLLYETLRERYRRRF